MTPRQQIKSLSVTSDPITTELSQEANIPSNDNSIIDAKTHCYVFLDYIWSKRKPVWGSENNEKEWSIEVEQDHIVMSRRYGGQEGNICHGHMLMS